MPTRTSTAKSTNAAPRRGRATRADTQAREEIIAMLVDDHKRAKKAFRDFEKLMESDDQQSAQALAEQTVAELAIHAELEEQLFYPAAREVIKEEDLVDEAEVEHMTFKVLMQQLQELDAQDDKYAATFKVLGEYVKHHVKEEESEMFPQVGSNRVDWPGLLTQMQEMRQQLMLDKGLIAEEDLQTQEEGDEEAEEAGTSSKKH